MKLKPRHSLLKRNDSERRKTKTIITKISPITMNHLKAKTNKLQPKMSLTIKKPNPTITKSPKKSLHQNKEKPSQPRIKKMERKIHNQRLSKSHNKMLRKKNN
jgi:hypothetical protein